MKGSSSQLICEMKAPSDSVVYWTRAQKQDTEQECLIPILDVLSTNDTAVCNTTAVVKKTREMIDDTYSIFHLELQVR